MIDMGKAKRMSVSLSEKDWARVEALSDKLNITEASVIRLAANAGMTALEMSVNPDWKSFFESEMKIEGKSVKKYPDR